MEVESFGEISSAACLRASGNPLRDPGRQRGEERDANGSDWGADAPAMAELMEEYTACLIKAD